MLNKGILYCRKEIKEKYLELVQSFERLNFISTVINELDDSRGEAQYDYAILLVTGLGMQEVTNHIRLKRQYAVENSIVIYLCLEQRERLCQLKYLGEGDILLQVHPLVYDFTKIEDCLKECLSHIQNPSFVAASKLLEKGFLQSVLRHSSIEELEEYMIAFQFDMKCFGCFCVSTSLITDQKRKCIRWFLVEHFNRVLTFGHIKGEFSYLFLLTDEMIIVDEAHTIANYIHSLGIEENEVGVSCIKKSFHDIHDAFMESQEDYLNKQKRGRDLEMYHIRICEEEIYDIVVSIGHKIFLGDMDGICIEIDQFMDLLLEISSVNRNDVVTYFLNCLSEELYYFKSPNISKIREMLKKEIEQPHRSSELNSIAISLTYLLKLIVKIIARNKEPQKHELLMRIYEFVEENYAKSIGLNEVADYLGVTPQYICMLFTQYTNTNFSKVLNFNRIIHAKKLLRKSMKIKEVAIMCGFHNINYFEKKFKVITGQTPREYQNMYK